MAWLDAASLNPALAVTLALLTVLAPSVQAQTPCPVACAAFVAPADLSRFNQSTGITAAVYVDDARDDANRRDDPNARLAGCIGGELRGVAPAQMSGGQARYFLSVAGDPNERGEAIALVYCSAQDGNFVAPLTPANNFDNSPTFEAGTSYGTPQIPYRVQARAEDLPVELVAWDAVADGADAALLTWRTASETGNAGFYVERETGSVWTQSAWIRGAGTTLETQSYRHRVTGLARGVYSFRLRQVDLDGAFEYSPVVEVHVGADPSLTLAPVRPNPSVGTIEARFTVARSGPARVSIYDLLGRRVAGVFDGHAEAGRTYRSIHGGELGSGIYVLVVESQGQRRTQPFVRVR